MAIIRRPKNVPHQTAPCVVCKQQRPLSAMGAGMHDAEERQAFACDGHFRDRNEYIIGWVDFAVAQQDKLVEREFAREYQDGCGH